MVKESQQVIPKIKAIIAETIKQYPDGIITQSQFDALAMKVTGAGGKDTLKNYWNMAHRAGFLETERTIDHNGIVKWERTKVIKEE